eukprot:8192875-Alexandrium_andersonii.AAC.1
MSACVCFWANSSSSLSPSTLPAGSVGRNGGSSGCASCRKASSSMTPVKMSDNLPALASYFICCC